MRILGLDSAKDTLNPQALFHNQKPEAPEPLKSLGQISWLGRGALEKKKRAFHKGSHCFRGSGGFRVWGIGFRVQGLGFRVLGLRV